MGTYTTNKELFMPSVGEQGWGTLVNNNFSIIDTLLKPIAVSGSTYTFTGNLVGNQSGGSISATSITNSGTLTNTGKITANGGIGTTSLTTSSTITSTGKITANGGIECKALTQTGASTFTGLITANGGVKGNLTGKLILSSVGSNSNNIKVYTASCSNPSSTIASGDSLSITITLPAGSVTRYNTGILTYNVSDSSILSASSATCTIKFYKPSGSERSYRCVVTRNSDGAVLVDGSTRLEGEVSYSWTFTRAFNQSYTITASRVSSSGAAVNVTTSTSSITRYAP